MYNPKEKSTNFFWDWKKYWCYTKYKTDRNYRRNLIIILIIIIIIIIGGWFIIMMIGNHFFWTTTTATTTTTIKTIDTKTVTTTVPITITTTTTASATATAAMIKKIIDDQSQNELINQEQVLSQDSSLSFLVIGDWGTDCERNDCREQKKVIRAMEKVSQNLHTSFVVSTGDQFYDEGVKSVNSRRFRIGFEDLFPKSLGDFYLVLGNHDSRLNPKAQIEYTQKSTRWKMPNWHFMQDFDIPKPNSPPSKKKRLRMLFVNTNSLLCSHNEWNQLSAKEQSECHEAWYNMPNRHIENPSHLTENYPPRDIQLEWLREKIEQSENDDSIAWVMVTGHHPLFSRGPHGIPNMLNKYLRPLFQKSTKVVAYLSGHNHGLEHYIWDRYNEWKEEYSPSHNRNRRQTKNKYFHSFMSGAVTAPLHAMDGLPPESIDSSIHLEYLGRNVNGFMSITVSEQSIMMQVWDDSATEKYTYTILT